MQRRFWDIRIHVGAFLGHGRLFVQSIITTRTCTLLPGCLSHHQGTYKIQTTRSPLAVDSTPLNPLPRHSIFLSILAKDNNPPLTTLLTNNKQPLFIIMSPVTAQVVRTMGRRQFSIIRSLRQVGRSMEAHPFERLPTAKAAPADWGRQFRRVGSQAVM